MTADTDNIIGAITGRAIYEGTLDLAEGQKLADELSGIRDAEFAGSGKVC